MNAEDNSTADNGISADLDQLMRMTKAQEDDFIRLGQVIGRLSSNDTDISDSIFVQDEITLCRRLQS